jgi:iron complex transport system substrate-binding protein
MYKLRRLLIIGILAFAFVSACRGNSPQQIGSQAENTSAEAVRVIDHAFGQTQVPINPQRVVVLNTGLDTALSLGVKPVGTVRVRSDKNYLKQRVEEVESIGNSSSPNLEAIVALKPDLILGTKWDGQNNYKLLSQIAPTVLAEVETSGDWKKMLSKYAEALGKTDKAEQIMADYHARIEEFQAQMGDCALKDTASHKASRRHRLEEIEVSIVNVRQNRIRVYLEDSFPGTIVADAGLPRPSHQANAKTPFAIEINNELLHLADGDIIFTWTSGDGIGEEDFQKAQTEWEQLKADPLWSKLNAVQQGKVYEVPGYWIGEGPIAANLVLDDLFEYLVDR